MKAKFVQVDTEKLPSFRVISISYQPKRLLSPNIFRKEYKIPGNNNVWCRIMSIEVFSFFRNDSCDANNISRTTKRSTTKDSKCQAIKKWRDVCVWNEA